ncbi:hypothetical protein [Azohydromonas caseinilytica]|nr:hypothetical protein [Azohydromonas caseinilytica]
MRNHGPLAALLLAAVLAFWTWQWQQAPQGAALEQGRAHATRSHHGGDDD